jgi:hypothetical protein
MYISCCAIKVYAEERRDAEDDVEENDSYDPAEYQSWFGELRRLTHCLCWSGLTQLLTWPVIR